MSSETYTYEVTNVGVSYSTVTTTAYTIDVTGTSSSSSTHTLPGTDTVTMTETNTVTNSQTNTITVTDTGESYETATYNDTTTQEVLNQTQSVQTNTITVTDVTVIGGNTVTITETSNWTDTWTYETTQTATETTSSLDSNTGTANTTTQETVTYTETQTNEQTHTETYETTTTDSVLVEVTETITETITETLWDYDHITDSWTETWTETYTVTVTHTESNTESPQPPDFVSPVEPDAYTFNVYSLATDDIYTFTVTDPDNAQTELTIEPVISLPVGFLLQDSVLKFDTNNAPAVGTYTFDLKVTDPSNLSDTANVVVYVESDQNLPPAFGQSAYTFDLVEGATGAVGTVNATDPDDTVDPNDVDYSLDPQDPDAADFEIDASTGQISLKTGVTAVVGAYTFTVFAQDGNDPAGGVGSATVTINVTANQVDLPPVFDEHPYTFQSVAVLEVHAIDPDDPVEAEKDNIIYSIWPSDDPAHANDHAKFEVLVSSLGFITAKPGESFEGDYYEFKVVAEDGNDPNGGYDETLVQISLIHNDPPQFTSYVAGGGGNPITFDASKTAYDIGPINHLWNYPNGGGLVTLVVEDDGPDSELEFKILGDSGPWIIDNTGYITIDTRQNTANFDTILPPGVTYNFHVIVRDAYGDFDDATVTITTAGEMGQAGQDDQYEIVAYLGSGTAPAHTFDVLANDNLSGNPRIVNVLLPPAEQGTVSVTSGNKIRFRPAPGFFGQVAFQYYAEYGVSGNHHTTDYINVTIDVGVTAFDSLQYYKKVDYSTPSGETVLQVHAESLYANVTYNIQSDEALPFEIDSDTGVITLEGDLTVGHEYVFTVYADDGFSGPPASTEVTLRVGEPPRYFDTSRQVIRYETSKHLQVGDVLISLLFEEPDGETVVVNYTSSTVPGAQLEIGDGVARLVVTEDIPNAAAYFAQNGGVFSLQITDENRDGVAQVEVEIRGTGQSIFQLNSYNFLITEATQNNDSIGTIHVNQDVDSLFADLPLYSFLRFETSVSRTNNQNQQSVDTGFINVIVSDAEGLRQAIADLPPGDETLDATLSAQAGSVNDSTQLIVGQAYSPQRLNTEVQNYLNRWLTNMLSHIDSQQRNAQRVYDGHINDFLSRVNAEQLQVNAIADLFLFAGSAMTAFGPTAPAGVVFLGGTTVAKLMANAAIENQINGLQAAQDRYEEELNNVRDQTVVKATDFHDGFASEWSNLQTDIQMLPLSQQLDAIEDFLRKLHEKMPIPTITTDSVGELYGAALDEAGQ
ncbi:MAG: cadherin repeat domain-containing protein [Planctomycetaceae bacterium]